MLLLPGVGSPETAGVLTEKLLAAIARPVQLQGQDIFMTACAGLAFFPDDGQEPEHLLRNADSALHRAKGNGPGTYQIYAQGMNELAHQRLARESELHQAVRRDELRVALPAADRPPHRQDRRRRGTRAVGAPHPRPARSDRVRAPGRGVRPHRRRRHLGAAAVDPPGGPVAAGRPTARARRSEPLGPSLPVP